MVTSGAACDVRCDDILARRTWLNPPTSAAEPYMRK
jgi:hypothetical protein